MNTQIMQEKNNSCDLIQVINNEPTTTSLIIADIFQKRHKDIIRNIEALVANLEDGVLLSRPIVPLLFEKAEYINSQNKPQPYYILNRNSFSLVAMGFNNTRNVLEWKLKYIAAFNEMEARLSNPAPQTPAIGDRLALARIVARTPYRNLSTIAQMFPEYFFGSVPDSLEYRSDVNTSYQRWIEEYGITTDWIGDFPTKDVYLNYVRYCTENHLPSMGKKNFYSTLEADFNLIRRQKVDGCRYFIPA